MPEPIEIPTSFAEPGAVRDRRVVITGAGRGLGAVLAHAFSQAGARVALVARTGSELEALADALPGSALVLPGDVAGPLQTDPDAWRRVLDVNLTGAFLGARAAARVMDPATGGDGGRIILTGSVLGDRPRAGLAAYSASKSGLSAMAKALALDLADAGITVNVVAPGWFASPLTEGWMADPERSEAITGHTAQRRWGDPADLPGAYLFLASDAARFVTGTTVTVDGGYLLV